MTFFFKCSLNLCKAFSVARFTTLQAQLAAELPYILLTAADAVLFIVAALKSLKRYGLVSFRHDVLSFLRLGLSPAFNVSHCRPIGQALYMIFTLFFTDVFLCELFYVLA